ncbi:hypothetical protein LBA_01177 [Megavirus lba]|uniref:Replication origin-binding protein domain-containing protein n=1 Tax=Megavirus lba TaxID=1235314 RepID=L7Y7U5_9VIRU|nr:hypothetical protein LBA_01177 [Megavirus lba]
MAKVFYKKNDMIESIKEADRNSKIYLQFPVSDRAYHFVVLDKNEDFFKNISPMKSKKKFLQEMFPDGTKRKPYLDIEHYYPSEKEFKKDFKRIMSQLVSDIIKVFDTEYKTKIKANDVLLLNSSGKSSDGYKLSVHMIVSPKNKTYYYTNSKSIENNTAYHLYTCLINLNDEYKDKPNFNDKTPGYLDPQVYRKDATLRMIGSGKFPTGERILAPIDSVTFEELILSNKDKLRYLISYVDDTKPIYLLNTPIIKQSTKNKIVYNKPTTTDLNNKILQLVKKLHPSAGFYGSNKNGYYNFNYTNRKEVCPITNNIHSGTNGFYVYEKSNGYFLGCHSSRCKGSIHIGYIDESEEFIDDAYQLNQQYLLQYPNMTNILDNWIDKKKTLAIKSAMGTGKTTLIRHVLDTCNMKKILWITHRQTLTKSLYGSFKDYGFVNYMDVQESLFEYDRVIVQIDSLLRIKYYDIFDDKTYFKRYDLIIIDEIEGCLSHYESPFLNKPDADSRDIFNFMMKIISTSKKLIVLDADIGIRTKLLIENTGNSISNNDYVFINNTYKPVTKNFIITNDEADFDKKIFIDIKAKKNICVVSMSASAINKLSIELNKMNIKHVTHTSKSNDKLKNELENVNDFWAKYQVVMFSPSIISGIDFNKKHFDKMYCIIRSGVKGTCDPRSFLQMVGRIRHLNNYDILCWYKQIPVIINEKDNKIIPKTCSVMYTFDDLLSYYRYYETLHNKKFIKNIAYEIEEGDDVVSMTRKFTDIDLFDKISLHNEVEQLNKHPDVFLTVLNKLIMKSDNKICFKLVSKNDKEKPMIKTNIKKNEIDTMVELDESKYNIKELNIKQTKNQLDETEKLVLKKYYFKKKLGIKKEIDNDKMKLLLDKFLDKQYLLERYETLFGYKKISDTNDDSKGKNKERIKRKIINDFVNRLLGKNYNKLDDSKLKHVIIEHDKYNKAINDIINNSMYFKDEEKYRPLFGKKSGKLKSDPKNKKAIQYYVNTLIDILKSYNIILKVERYYKNKGERLCTHSLSVDKQVKDIIYNKYVA